MEHFLSQLSDAAGALALLTVVATTGYLIVRFARRKFPTAAEKRLLDQQDAILDALTSIEERLQTLEGNPIAGDETTPRPQLPERIPTPV